MHYDFLKEDHKGSFHTDKTQYDWFPGKSQNSFKFNAKFKQNPTTSKNHRAFLNIVGGLTCPPGGNNNFLGSK